MLKPANRLKRPLGILRDSILKSTLFLLFCGHILLAGNVFAAPPDDCLLGISQALDSGDLAAFENLVDMDALLNEGFTAFTETMAKNSSSLGPMLAIMMAQLSGENGQAIKNLLLGEIRAFINNGITSGAFAGKELAPGQSRGVLAPLFANASLGRKEIRGIGESIRSGENWITPFTVHDYGNDNDYPLIGKFAPADKSARLVGIENLDQIFLQIQKEASQ